MHEPSRVMGMERSRHPGYHVPAKSPLAPMVNRVLTSPYLWCYEPSPPRCKGRGQRPLRVLALSYGYDRFIPCA
jgi:hypothetical protein